MSAYAFKLPDIGYGTTEAEIAEWYVNVGDTVREDQVLIAVMTDKATVELTSPVAGVVTRLGDPVGHKAAVGSVLVTIEIAETALAPKSAVVIRLPNVRSSRAARSLSVR